VDLKFVRGISQVVCAAISLLASVALASACGTERRLVKVAADQNAVLIADFARTAGIADLAAIAAPGRPDARPNSRFAPAELTVYQVSGTFSRSEENRTETIDSSSTTLSIRKP
jgi:hypothetical protein